MRYFYLLQGIAVNIMEIEKLLEMNYIIGVDNRLVRVVVSHIIWRYQKENQVCMYVLLLMGCLFAQLNLKLLLQKINQQQKSQIADADNDRSE